MTRPVPMGDARTHFWLAKGMADTVGADLGTAFAEGRLSNDDWASLVTACRTCTAPCACREFVDATPEAAAPPDYCVNRDRLMALAK